MAVWQQPESWWRIRKLPRAPEILICKYREKSTIIGPGSFRFVEHSYLCIIYGSQVDWKQCNNVRKTHFFRSCFIPQGGDFHEKETTNGNCNLSVHPTIAVQKQSDFTKGSFHFIPQGACKPEKFFFAKPGLSDGLVRGQRKRSCNISFLSLTRAAQK